MEIYRDNAQELLDKGWWPMPLPRNEKYPPPSGFTGIDGKGVEQEDVDKWSKEKAKGNIGVRLPIDFIGIDVDTYDDKPGAETLASWPELPETITVTSRDDGLSGKRIYRVPPGYEDMEWEKNFPGIEIIQFHHRYIVAPPSFNSKSQKVERWTCAGLVVAAGELEETPNIEDAAMLPQEFISVLNPRPRSEHLQPTGADLTTVGFHDGTPCWKVERALTSYTPEDGAARHDHMVRVLERLAHLGSDGHTGVPEAAQRLIETFVESTGDPDRQIEAERAWQGSVARVGQTPATKCNCTDMTQEMFTDSSLAELAAFDILENSFRWVRGIGWYSWTGKLWEEVSDERVGEAIRQWAKAKLVEAAQSGNNVQAAQWIRVQKLSQRESILKQARGIMELPIDKWDADPDVLNTPSGIVDLRTGVLGPHNPHAYCTKITSGSYRPGFKHPDWTMALEALRDDARDWMQVVAGQAISGRISERDKMPLLHGDGGNGKSLLATDGLLPAAGGYGVLAPQRLLTRRAGDHSTETMLLRGARLVVIEELAEGTSFNPATLKQILGSHVLTARKMRQDDVTFTTSHTMFATSNHLPRVSDTSNGIWRRIAIVNFPYTFRVGNEDMDAENDKPGDELLKSRIVDNESGQHDAIVTWMVEGAKRWYDWRAAPSQKSPLDYPPSVQEDTEKWIIDSDLIAGFWEEILVSEPGSMIEQGDLFASYERWAEDQGMDAGTRAGFSQRFEGSRISKKAKVSKRRLRGAADLRKVTSSNRMGEWGNQPYVWVGVAFTSKEREKVSDLFD